jgi:hypothetical protein
MSGQEYSIWSRLMAKRIMNHRCWAVLMEKQYSKTALNAIIRYPPENSDRKATALLRGRAKRFFRPDYMGPLVLGCQ